MMIWDLFVYLAFAKLVVLLLEDASYNILRGKRSPRQQQRAKDRAAAAAGQPVSAPATGLGRAGTAVGGYLAGLVEDATAGARARRRRAIARRRGRKAVDGMFVDPDDGGDGFVADCDLCGWSSRPFRVEANALAAGREHTRTEHPEAYHEDPPADTDDDGQADPGQADSEQAEPGQAEPAAGDSGEQEAGERPRLRVIPGGAQDPDPQAAPAEQVVPEQPAAGTGPADQPQPQAAAPAPASPAPADDEDGGPQTEQEWEREREALRASQREHLGGPNRVDPGPARTAGPAGAGGRDGGAVNSEATGPQEIRDAFAQAAEHAGSTAEDLGGLAAVLGEAADRYEGLEMSETTVERLRDAAQAVSSAKADLDRAQESLQAALADFNAKDGQVADAAADAGNLAAGEVLVGGVS